MKNENLFPLERNNYFFGKLMTEREYNKEQAYFNNKRRLFNAALIGSGVLHGMVVTKVDGATIAVESGLAFDGTGRELAVPQIIVTRLSEMDGFTDDSGLAPYVYLCAEYSESQAEPVHSLGDATGETRYGYTRETVRLYLRYGEPEPFEVARPEPDGYREESLEKLFDRGARERLYLARIYLVRWEEAYEIDSIQQVPFGQYACVLALPCGRDPEVREEQRRVNRHEHAPDAPWPATSFGMVQVNIPEGTAPGSLHYSEYIPHNLGLVPAAVTLGLSTDEGVIFGDSGIFGERAEFDYAVRVWEDEGAFQIGVRMKTRTRALRISFIWSAVADPARAGANAPVDARIIVTPQITRINTLQSLRYMAEIHGMPDTEIFWSIRENGGGDITRGGVYTAPADPGVYTVIASAGEVSATALVVVQ